MKTQSYYRCENCGKIVAKDSGTLLNSCPDCGSEKISVLVPMDDEARIDPLSSRKKKGLAALIISTGIAVVTVFLIFGRLLQEYIEFDASRMGFEKANQRLALEIQEKEATLTVLLKKAQDEKLQASENVKQIEASSTIQKLVLEETESALQRALASLSNQTSKVSGKQIELSNLEDERNRLRKKTDNLTAEEAVLSATINDALSRTNQILSEVVAANRMRISAIAELTKITTELEATKKSQEKTKEQMETLLARVAVLSARKDSLEEDIQGKQKMQAALDATIAEAKNQKASNLENEAKSRAVLDTLLTARDKAREEADIQSARAAKLKAEAINLENTKTNINKENKGVTK